MNHINCPKCKSTDYHKDGIVRAKQRYHCKGCDYRFTVRTITRSTLSTSLRRKALVMYIEGMSSREIGRCLNISHVTIQSWVKDFEGIKYLRKSGYPQKVKLDFPESHSPGPAPVQWLIIGITEHECISYITEKKKSALFPGTYTPLQNFKI